MDLALRAALVSLVLALLGGTTERAFFVVDEILAEVGEVTDEADLLRFMTALDARAAEIVVW